MIKIGRLYRKVKVTTIRKQKFTPSWASTQVYGQKTGEHLTLVFTIPDDCPKELFPLEVLVSTDILDVRHESGMQLPLRFADETGKFYGQSNKTGYKFVFTVDAPGSQRIYFENILPQTGGSSVISLEAEHATYQGEGDITVTFEVGLGHLDGIGGIEGDDTFYVVYRIIEAPWSANASPAWEKRVDYNESWYSDKFLSTEPEEVHSFIFPRYGEFYPIYKENVDIVFPENVEKGYLMIWLYCVADYFEEDQLFFSAELYFTHENGTLVLEP